MTESPIDLSVVIPAYNEAGRLEPGLRRAVEYLRGRGRPFELLVIDDGSRDAQCGFKLAAGDVGRSLFSALAIDGFAWDVEMIWLARRRGYGIAEVGVVWIHSPDSRVDPIRSSLSMLRDVVLMRFRHRG